MKRTTKYVALDVHQATSTASVREARGRVIARTLLLLRRGSLRAVYHGTAERAVLKDLTRNYQSLVEDSTRAMLRQGLSGAYPRRAPRHVASLLPRGDLHSRPCEVPGRGPVPPRPV